MDQTRSTQDEFVRKVNHHPFVSQAFEDMRRRGSGESGVSRSDANILIEAVLEVAVSLLRGDHEMEVAIMHARRWQ